jgi:hypothetical protein
MDQTITATLEDKLIGKTIKELVYFNIDDNYLLIEEERMAVIDGGISVRFNDSVFSFGWNYDFQTFRMTEEDIRKGFDELPYYQIEACNVPFAESLANQKVSALHTHWNSFDCIDADMQLTGEKVYSLGGIVFLFEDGQTLLIASVTYDAKFGRLHDFRYADEYGELLFTVNNIVDIARD